MEKISKELCEEIKRNHINNRWVSFYDWLDSITEKESDLVKGLKETREDHGKEGKKKIEPLDDINNYEKINGFTKIGTKLKTWQDPVKVKINEIIEWINNN